MILFRMLRPCQGRRFLVAFCRKMHAERLQYAAYGEPLEVLTVASSPLPPPGPTEVRVKMLAAPINPADINQVQGVYPIKPALPAVGGNEGVGRIDEVGSKVSDLNVGDWVVPMQSGYGTWRSGVIWDRSQVMKIPNDLPLITAATLAINPPTAYRMLNDFVKLHKGDVVIQNGANSVVGQMVIQLCRKYGLVSINVIRDRPNLVEVENHLRKLGADHVFTDEQLRSKEGREAMKTIPKPKLALNCVSGKSTLYLSQWLAVQGVMVTYGGMSKQPLQVSTGSFIFQDISMYGFWMSHWNLDPKHADERTRMLQDLCQMFRNQELQPPLCELVPFKDYKLALEKSTKGKVDRKQVLVFEWEL
ncbi:unnamed protein product [Soboliphyme baturini]|uniref:Enoyl-[acyl-carrier-protein] reductase, mitochondrial n=1 Tax=Soboliphyme baturini TaxID=241478 RepID=A0A183IJY9_9BILA|nr:unnamed protein product [Soboliphyme baturini]